MFCECVKPCVKPGHSPNSENFPASISKSPVCVSKGHWSVKGHSPTGTGKGTTECAFELKNDFSSYSREMGMPFVTALFTGSYGKNSVSDSVIPPIHTEGTDWSINPDIQEHPGSPCIIPEAEFSHPISSIDSSPKVGRVNGVSASDATQL